VDPERLTNRHATQIRER